MDSMLPDLRQDFQSLLGGHCADVKIMKTAGPVEIPWNGWHH